jgi:hypothetical protein
LLGTPSTRGSFAAEAPTAHSSSGMLGKLMLITMLYSFATGAIGIDPIYAIRLNFVTIFFQSLPNCFPI